MNLKAKKEFLLPLLGQVQTLLEKRATLPVFSNICIKAQDENKAVIYASDSELSFSASFPAEIQKEATFAINGKRFFEIVRELKEGSFELSSSENFKLEIKQDRSKFKVPGLNPDDYPSFPKFNKKNKQSFKVGELLNIIDKTLYCVSLDESRYHLTGVFMEKISSSFRFVATDGHRMSFLDLKTSKEAQLKEGVIIPKKALQELKKMLSQGDSQDSVDFYIEKPSLLIQFKNQELNIRLIEGKYPDYKQLIPNEKENQKIQIKRESFQSSLKRISVLTSARFKGVVFGFKKNKISLHFSHAETGEASEELDCQYSGEEELKVRFNVQYILEILNSMKEDELEFSILNNRSPGLIRPQGDSSYTCLVMPMKL